MNVEKYSKAIQNIKDSVSVGGTLADAPQTIIEIQDLYENFKRCRNELCLMCGNYKTSHAGSCNGCKSVYTC